MLPYFNLPLYFTFLEGNKIFFFLLNIYFTSISHFCYIYLISNFIQQKIQTNKINQFGGFQANFHFMPGGYRFDFGAYLKRRGWRACLCASGWNFWKFLFRVGDLLSNVFQSILSKAYFFHVLVLLFVQLADYFAWWLLAVQEVANEDEYFCLILFLLSLVIVSFFRLLRLLVDFKLLVLGFIYLFLERSFLSFHNFQLIH